MSAPNITRWIGISLLGLPLYGVLTYFSSLNSQPVIRAREAGLGQERA